MPEISSKYVFPVLVDLCGDFAAVSAGSIRPGYGRYGHLEFGMQVESEPAALLNVEPVACQFAMTREAALALAQEIRRMCGADGGDWLREADDEAQLPGDPVEKS
jgi:hypothetical protein